MNKKQFMYDYQLEAVQNMSNGCILNGGVGSGKSRTALYYYFTTHGGKIDINKYIKMKDVKDLYIITTARKRDTLEWESEMGPFMLSKSEPKLYKHNIVIDSWNNIKLPKRASIGSAGYDFYVPYFVFSPCDSAVKILTGIRWVVDRCEQNKVLMLFPRSGLGCKYGLFPFVWYP